MPIRKGYKGKGRKKMRGRKRPVWSNKWAMSKTISTRADLNLKLHAEPLIIANDSTQEARNAFAFSFQNCLNYSSWSTLFDQYRINCIVVKFVPVQTELINRPFDDTTNPGVSVSEIPRFVVAQDRDDSVTPLDFNAVLQRQGAICRKATKPITLKFVPNRLVQLYNGVTTGYKIDRDTKAFLDCAQPGIQHYGIKTAMEATSPSNCYQYRMEVSYYISLKVRRS